MAVLLHVSKLSSLALLILPLAQAHECRRKSLSFRQPHPNSQFNIHPPPISGDVRVDAHPHDVARLFLKEHVLGDNPNFYIRGDSYTDQLSGVSHVYVRQLINGIEVADGIINLNIRDGKVLSFGNTFYNESTRRSILTSAGWSQEAYCNQVTSKRNPFACQEPLVRARQASLIFPGSPTSPTDDPRVAAYSFLYIAAPENVSLNTYLDWSSASLGPCRYSFSQAFTGECWAISGVPGTTEPIQARKVYTQTVAEEGNATDLNLSWRLEVTLEQNRYEAYVSANSPSQIITVADRISDAARIQQGRPLNRRVFEQQVLTLDKKNTSSCPALVGASSSVSVGGRYCVWRWGVNDPDCGNRTLEIMPYYSTASPLGWHSLPASKDPIENHPELDENSIWTFTTTVGNNVIAHPAPDKAWRWKEQRRPDGGPELVFDFPYGANPWEVGWEKIQPVQYINASVTQLFYVANMFHDLFYLYGFDEISGNFQQHNFDKGGKGDDAIIIEAQVNSRTNRNSPHSTLNPDGGRMNIFMPIWDRTSPVRDGGLDAGAFIHELSHGLSYRLTGGPSTGDCLDSRQAQGLSEGWSDFIATVVRSTHQYQNYPIGAWSNGHPGGLRKHLYSKDFTINPLVYGAIQNSNFTQYDIGEVWAEALWVVFNELVDEHGFADSLFPSNQTSFYYTRKRENGAKIYVPNQGNTLMLQLVVNGLKLQPCHPTLIHARDGIISADQDLTGGANECLLWKAFAYRGLGSNAQHLKDLGEKDTSVPIDGYQVPSQCQKEYA